MKQEQRKYEHPIIRKDSLSLSGEALIELMKAVLARGLPFRFTARGFSMSPFIRDGDVISVFPICSRPPGRGEVVAFLNREKRLLCVHRVLSVTKGAILIQGDNMPGKPDGWIPLEDVIGRITRVERSGKQIVLGIGPERFLIALLSRSGLLETIRRCLGPFCRYLKKGNVSCANP